MDKKQITSAFEKSLSQHGYGFQYAVLKEIEELCRQKKSFWVPWITEFPVEIQGKGTRIDIILKHYMQPWYVICECKRVNPALAQWCFARAPMPSDPYVNRAYVETLRSDGNHIRSELIDIISTQRVFQVALEVTSDKKGEVSGLGRGQIEESATQVCRGFNGLIQFFATRNNPSLLKVNERVGFIPVIVTTADIFATEAEVVASELGTGKVTNLSPPLTPRDWIWYEYPQSPGLKHTVHNYDGNKDLSDIYFAEFARRIAIIKPEGLESFFGMRPWQSLTAG